MTVKLLTERHLEFLSLKGGYTGSPEATLVKMPHCWKSHVAAHFTFQRDSCTIMMDRKQNVEINLCEQTSLLNGFDNIKKK